MERDKRYRFRVINAASNVCPMLLQIENHKMSVIASDGSTFKPHEIDTLFFISGERYDIVVKADKEQIRDYFIRIRAMPPCTRKVQDFAILRYHQNSVPNDAKSVDFDNRIIPTFDERWPDGIFFNSHQPLTLGIPISQAESYRNDKDVINQEADETFRLFIGTPRVENDVLFSTNSSIKFMVTSQDSNYNNVGVINNISTTFPQFSLLTQNKEIDENTFCDSYHLQQSERIELTNTHRCIHRLKVKLGSIVELLIYDVNDSLTHPFHLHGHKFYV